MILSNFKSACATNAAVGDLFAPLVIPVFKVTGFILSKEVIAVALSPN